MVALRKAAMWKKHFRARDKENQPPHHQTSHKLKPQDVFDNIQSLPPPPLKFFHNRSHSKASSSIYSQPSPRHHHHHHNDVYSAHKYGDYHVPLVDDHPATRDPNGLNSHFSWSTRATEFQLSPPPSPPPAIPPRYMTGPPRLPSAPDTGSFSGGVFGSTLRHAPSIRTVDTEGTHTTIASAVTTRKPVPSPRGPVANVKRQESFPSPRVSPVPNPYQLSSYGPVRREVSSPVPSGSSRAGTPTTNKNLPPTPAFRNLSIATGSSEESVSGPKTIDTYQVQMDELYRRRHNITRIIQDLTQSPELTNPLTTDFATKRANERRVKKLEAELADVIREEHDIGMKLHRIRKRQEREEGNDGGMTALWVRRVTTH